MGLGYFPSPTFSLPSSPTSPHPRSHSFRLPLFLSPTVQWSLRGLCVLGFGPRSGRHSRSTLERPSRAKVLTRGWKTQSLRPSRGCGPKWFRSPPRLRTTSTLEGRVESLVDPEGTCGGTFPETFRVEDPVGSV